MGKPHTYVYVPDTTSAKKFSDASAAIFDRYDTAYKPSAQKLIADLNDASIVSDGSAAAGNQSAAAFDSMQGSANRNTQRFGAGMGMQVAAATDRASALNEARAVGAARTGGRREMIETREQIGDAVINVGQGVRGMGMDAMSQAASLENQRNEQGYADAAARNARAAAKASSKNQMLGTVMTVAGTAIGACFGAPWLGMAAGGAVGGVAASVF